jgi:hypothetical protein
VIGGYLLLGRLGHSDEVSLDQINWVPLEDVPELLPLNRLTDTVAADYENKKWQEERYRAALRWADERQVNERRKGASDEEPIEPKPEHPRSKTDRRRVEEGPDILALRELHIQGELQRRRKRDRYFGVAAALLILVAGAIAAAMVYAPVKPFKVGIGPYTPTCQQAAAPLVNWSNCDKSGAWLRGADLKNADLGWARLNSAQLGGSNLAYANLAGADLNYADLSRAQLFGANLANADLGNADLSGADLRYADLRGSKIEAATLTGARLEHAIWPDGRRCAEGSVGLCK